MTPMLGKVDLGKGVSDAFGNVAAFVPKLLAFLVILIVGYFVAKAIAKVLAKVLERVGFDRAVERGGVKKALAQSKYEPATCSPRWPITPSCCSCSRWPSECSAPTPSAISSRR